MKIPYLVDCIQCGHKNTHWAYINDLDFEQKCHCGEQSRMNITLTITIGLKLLYKAGYELDKNEDYSASIIFSAMAFEAEQMKLYKKWYELGLEDYVEPIQIDKDVREIFKEFQGAKKKLDETIKKLTGKQFNEYIKGRSTFLESMRKIYPELNGDDPLGSFHEIQYMDRNNIIHGANYSHSKEKALEVYNVARNGIALLRLIDRDKRADFHRVVRSGIQGRTATVPTTYLGKPPSKAAEVIDSARRST